MNTNRIYESRLTGKFYPETADGERIDLTKPFEADLSQYDLFIENNSYRIYDKIKKDGPAAAAPILGTEAKNAYVTIRSGNAKAKSAINTNVRGYFKGVKVWYVFDNTGPEWLEEEVEEEALCIEWLKIQQK